MGVSKVKRIGHFFIRPKVPALIQNFLSGYRVTRLLQITRFKIMNSARYPAYIYPERFNGRVRAFFKLKPASLLRTKRISGLRKKKVVVTSKARINRLLSHRKILDYGTSAFFLYPCTSFLGKVVANPQSCYTFKFIYRQLTRRKQGVAQTLVEEKASKLLRIILAQQAKKHAAVPDFDRASLMLGSAIPENIPDA
jgi:hypothetical protein